jgi:hypothetical protein
MDTSIKKHIEQMPKEKVTDPVRLYNPDALDFTKDHRISSIEATDTYTRIDFIYRSSHEYVNGGWIQIDAGCYISPTNSLVQFKLIRAIGIPIAPQKYFFKRCGEFHTYTLIFPALPKNTRQIDIIEKEAPGTYFNFYGIDYSRWMTVAHPVELPMSKN